MTVERLDAHRFLDMRTEWEHLVDRSVVDPLFMGWAWQSAWWETWSRPLGLELFLFGVYQGDTLVGIAPFFRRLRRLPLAGHVVELHLIGNAWRIAPTVRTEYLDLIVDREERDEVVRALANALADQRWDLIVYCDHAPLVVPSDLQMLARMLSLKHLPRSPDYGVRIETAGDFSQWQARLGRNTRLKAYNRRRYLHKTGTSMAVVPEADAERALGILNDFHLRRWGKPCFEHESLAFHRRLLRRLGSGHAGWVTSLRLNGKVRSLLYDLRAGDTVYNLQAGFDEEYDPKVSVGTLHLGFAIESAFADRSVRFYDLLAGAGKKSFYKRRFRGVEVRFDGGVFLRTRWVKLAGSIYDVLPRRLSRGLGQWLNEPRVEHQ